MENRPVPDSPLGILISGRGSNLRAIVEATRRGRLNAHVALVLSNRADAKGLEFARESGLDTRVISHRDYGARETFDAALAGELHDHGVKLVCLAGFMRFLGPGFLAAFPNAVLNIHPSLLPAFPGLSTHARALSAGVKVHGCTVHFVTAELDHGPIVIQAAIPVRPGETPESLAARVLREEHQVYPRAIQWFLEGRLVVENGVVRVKGNDAQLSYSDRT